MRRSVSASEEANERGGNPEGEACVGAKTSGIPDSSTCRSQQFQIPWRTRPTIPDRGEARAMCGSPRGRPRSNEDINISRCGHSSPAPLYLARCDWPVGGFAPPAFPPCTSSATACATSYHWCVCVLGGRPSLRAADDCAHSAPTSQSASIA